MLCHEFRAYKELNKQQDWQNARNHQMLMVLCLCIFVFSKLKKTHSKFKDFSVSYKNCSHFN